MPKYHTVHPQASTFSSICRLSLCCGCMQSLFIAILSGAGVIKTIEDSKNLQNFLIACEMLPAAIFMLWAFPYTDYKTSGEIQCLYFTCQVGYCSIGRRRPIWDVVCAVRTLVLLVDSQHCCMLRLGMLLFATTPQVVCISLACVSDGIGNHAIRTETLFHSSQQH